MSTDGPPIIDLSNFEERKEEIKDELMKAATTIGFFYITNHGIPQELIDRAFAINDRYFNQPAEVKAKYPSTDWAAVKLLGYEVNSMSEGGLVRESCIQKFPVHKEMEKVWPREEDCPNFKDTTIEFMEALPPVVDRLMSLFALGIGFREDYFKDITDVNNVENNTFLQYHKYPSWEGVDPSTWEQGVNRITAHTDESLMTLLFTSPGSVGLELAAGKDGQAVGSENGHYTVDKWTDCPPKPGCITVNVGDPLQFWSDGLLKSNYHRVRMPKPGESLAARYSMGWFVWPKDNVLIQGPQKKYPPTTMTEFMKVKGALYGASFNPDPEVYKANQHIAFGLPQVAATAIPAAS
ncbi:Clavaminate synthase-like protein [Coccomyxa subellipsoidea C-169]|uniref:Clavaminate synthase-like protein n=1 Tax=Coccomyxa subellipsoidea (strain C-169) TaxID=574566 RepID=I0YLW7_COCSC|nr:Clavaminate synthase-like protein [Coccomyxa subellipsoidea C-169]EIE19386.1 Clavaminate synthase-like protein [Coccomyxa subellipsoidea C-169]|eukprot:XP_005643930.1 Clavaminate synthase-like protein [Coccomyxa subellipsoidea C-169]